MKEIILTLAQLKEDISYSIDIDNEVILDSDGKPISLYNYEVNTIAMYLLTRKYGAYNRIIVDDLDDETESLRRIGVIRESDPNKTVNLLHRVIIFEKSNEVITQAMLATKVRDFYHITDDSASLYDDASALKASPRYVYIEGLESYDDYRQRTAEIEGLTNIIILYYTNDHTKFSEKYSDVEIKARIFKFTSDCFPLDKNEETISRLLEHGVGLEGYTNAIAVVRYLKSIPNEYLLVGSDFPSSPIFAGALAYANIYCSKKPFFVSGRNKMDYLQALLDFYSGKFGTLYDKVTGFILTARPDTIRINLGSAYLIPSVCIVKKAIPNLKFAVIKWEEVKKCVAHGYELIDPSDALGMQVSTSRSFDIFEQNSDGSIAASFLDPIKMLNLNMCEDPRKIDDAEHERIYRIFRIIDQYCAKYSKLTTLRNVLMFRYKGEVYIGQGEFKPQAVVDLIQLGASNVIADDIKMAVKLVDTDVVYDMATYNKNTGEIELNDAIGRQVIDTYAQYGVGLDAVELHPIESMEQLRMQCVLWNYATREFEYIYEGPFAAYFEIARNTNYSFTEIFCEVLFRYIKPYGFRELIHGAAPVTIFGGPNISSVTSDVMLFKNVFKTPNTLGVE